MSYNNKLYRLIFRLKLKSITGASASSSRILGAGKTGLRLANYTSHIVAMLNKWHHSRLGFKCGVLLLVVHKAQRGEGEEPAPKPSCCVLILCLYLYRAKV